jgi:hypothetical protein
MSETTKKAKPKVSPISESEPIERGLPANLDAERFVLGSVLLDDEQFAEAAALQPDDFSLQRHKEIFSGMMVLHASEEHIDRVTVAEELARRGQLGQDGLSYLVSLDDGIPQIVHIGSYVRIVRDKAILRRAIFAAQKVMNEALLETASPVEILESHLASMQELSQRAASASVIRSVAEIPPVRDCGSGDAAYIRKPELPRGAVTALTGDAGSGKSTLATAWSRDAAQDGVPVLILDRENPLPVVIDRLERLGAVDQKAIKIWGGWLSQQAPLPDAPVVLDWVKLPEPKPLVIVDSLSGFFDGDQNDAGEMRSFLHRCRRLADMGASVAVIHHSGKAETARDYRGSSDFLAAIDQAFHCTSFGDGGRLDKIVLRAYKSRLGFAGELIYQYADGRFIREDAAEVGQTITEQLTVLLRLNPGVTAKGFEDLANERGLGRNRARGFLGDGIRCKAVRFEPSAKGGKRYFLAGMEAQGEL